MAEYVAMDDGAQLWTESRVEPGRVGCLMIRGGPGMWDYLGPVGDMLDGLVSVHRYDQRGCGRSGPSDQHTCDRYVRDIDGLRQHFGYEKWIILGHSFGARLALAYAATYPRRVVAIVHSNGVGIGWDARRDAYNRQSRSRLTIDERERLVALGARSRTWDEEVEWRTLSWMTDYAPGPNSVRAAREVARTPLNLNVACNRRFAAVPGAFWDDRAEQVSAPALLLHGTYDPRPVEGVRELHALLPISELVTLAAGHTPWTERPSEYAEALRTFVGCATDGSHLRN